MAYKKFSFKVYILQNNRTIPTGFFVFASLWAIPGSVGPLLDKRSGRVHINALYRIKFRIKIAIVEILTERIALAREFYRIQIEVLRLHGCRTSIGIRHSTPPTLALDNVPHISRAPRTGCPQAINPTLFSCSAFIGAPVGFAWIMIHLADFLVWDRFVHFALPVCSALFRASGSTNTM